ncbi:hypothetical protein [Kribbella sp. NPDC051770]|uniref:hypothetical protein n=1 Tax=Kribbella sp. NPDC051770 TaxID=3155413 RepID=UPI00342F7CCC
MSDTSRTIKVKFDGDAKGLARASKEGEREVDKFAKNTEKSFNKAGDKASRSFGASMKKWFRGDGAGLFAEVGKSGGTVFGSGLLGALKTPVLGPALVAAIAAAAAVAMPAAGAIAGAGLVAGFGAGIAGLGLVFAARSDAVKNAWSATLSEMGSTLTTLSKPFEQTLVDMLASARRTFGNFVPALGAAFAKMAPVLSGFGDQIGKAFDKFEPAIAPITSAFNEVIRSLGPALVDMSGNISQGFIDLADSVRQNPDALADMTRGVGNLTRDLLSLITTLNNLNGQFKSITGVSAVTAVFEGLRGAVHLLLGPFAALGGILSNGSRVFGSLKGSSDAAGSSMSSAAAQTVALARAHNGLPASVQGGANALEDEKKKANEAAAAFEDLIQKTFRLSNATLGLSGAQISFQAAIDSATASVKSNGRTLDINTEKGRANRTALNSVASSANSQTEAMLRAGKGNVAAAQTAEKSRANFVKLATQMGLSRSQADAMARQMIAIPNVDRRAKLTADKKDLDAKLAAARQQLADPKLTATKRAKLEAEISQLLRQKAAAQAAINSLTGKTVTLTFFQRVIGQKPPQDIGVRLPGRASGGPVQPRRQYLVGERGPEVLTMGNTPGRITSAEATKAFAGSDRPLIVENHIEIGGEVVRVVRTEIKKDHKETKRTVNAGVR